MIGQEAKTMYSLTILCRLKAFGNFEIRFYNSGPPPFEYSDKTFGMRMGQLPDNIRRINCMINECTHLFEVRGETQKIHYIIVSFNQHILITSI